jgi:DNA-binding SARP family transcriptional activator
MAGMLVERRQRSRGHTARLSLFGGFTLFVEGSVVPVPEASQRLLVYLALRGRAQSRAVVAGELWPEKDERRAAANLRSALWRLGSPSGIDLVLSRGTLLEFNPAIPVDTRDAERLGWELVNDKRIDLAACDPGLFLQELLPGWYDDWVILERERIGQLQIRFLDALAHARLEQGQLVEALDLALRLVALDPFRERSQEALLCTYLAEGDVRRAHDQLAVYCGMLRENFGCEPTPRLQRIFDETLAHR